MPHRVAVKCPTCGACADFEFAEVCRIQRREHVKYFQKSDVFEYRKFQNTDGHFWHAAVYYEGLFGDPKLALHDLPEGYEPQQWAHSRYLYRSHGLDLGSIRCKRCHHIARHELRWPDEAFFSITYRKAVLWAFNRESAIELLNFIEATSRETTGLQWRSFLLHVPTEFKTAKARPVVCQRLRRLLEPGQSARATHRSRGTSVQARS